MAFLPGFLSIVFVVRNQSDQLEEILNNAVLLIAPAVKDYELIVVDNASTDESIVHLKSITDANGIPNVQVYALSKEVDSDTATWVGLENALGDYIAVVDPFVDDINFLPRMMDEAASGADLVFANNLQKQRQNLMYSIAFALFNNLYRRLNNISISDEVPQYRILSKRVVNYMLQYPQPVVVYRHLAATSGFVRRILTYSTKPANLQQKNLSESIDRGVRLLISTTRAPMRIVTSLSLLGAFVNILYSGYILYTAAFGANVARGWASLSLQQSGMFFLISLVLFILGEYILQMARLSTEGPLYHVAQEFTSSRISRREKLNIEEVHIKEYINE